MEARTQMLIAAYKAGFAFTRAGVGNVHAIAHTLGGLYNTPHGLANAVILPIVLEDYGPAVYEKLAHLAELTGLNFTGTEEEKAKSFIAEIRAMGIIGIDGLTREKSLLADCGLQLFGNLGRYRIVRCHCGPPVWMISCLPRWTDCLAERLRLLYA